VVAALIALYPFTGGKRRTGHPRPNVLCITLDTTRADRLGCYGYEAALTPALDALAAAGTLFEQAFTSCPQTLPAHATIFTGLDPPEHGVRINGRDRLGAMVPTLAEILAARGYRTAAFVAAFVVNSKFGLARGFQTYDEDLTGAQKQELHEPLSVYRAGNLVTDAALAWLERAVAPPAPEQGTDQSARPPPPFFCWIHLFDPHYPYHAHNELAGTRFEGVASYDAEVAFMDRQVARLTAFLREHDLTNRTLVIAVGDHGEGLGDHGETEHGYLLNDEVLRVPLMVSLPGVVRAGGRVTAVVSLADLAPTVLDLLGIAADVQWRGRSLEPALTASADIGSRPSYGETDLPYAIYGWSPLRSLTTPEWKYVRTARPELYDRRRDPRETSNLASAEAAKLRELDDALSAIEVEMVARVAPAAALDARERQQLERLGYLAAGAAADPHAGTLKDIKDMLPTKHLETQLLRAKSLGTVGRTEQLEIARELVRRSPETGSFQNRLGAALLGAGRVEEALEHLTEAARLRPDLAAAHSNLGAALARQGRLDDAIARYSEALRLEPDLAEAHFRMANALADQGKLDAALARYTEAVRLEPDYAEAHYNMATVLAQRGDPAAAIEHYGEALRVKRDFPAAHHNVANLLAQRGSAAEAIEHYRAAVRLEPDFASAHYALARTLEAQGRFAEAIGHYGEALRISPGEPELVNALAWLLATCARVELRDARRALELAEKAVALTGRREARMLRTLAAAYAESRRFGEAAETARTALGLARNQGQEGLARDIEGEALAYEAGARSGPGR
jgi:arylsulfatase A-like enzyme/cytochrome c-type biogenesis protein CcmH/NrfG